MKLCLYIDNDDIYIVSWPITCQQSR